jgi:hypothetical protein
LIEKYEAKLKTGALAALTGSVKIETGSDGFFIFGVYDNDPKFVAALADNHVSELYNLLGSSAVTEAHKRRMFFEKQLQVIKENFTKSCLALKSSRINISMFKSSPASAVEAVARLKAGMSVQEVKLGTMRNCFAESSPDFKQALSGLTSIKTQLEKVCESSEDAVIRVPDITKPPEKKDKSKTSIIATLASVFYLLLFFTKKCTEKCFSKSRSPATNKRIASFMEKSTGSLS